MTSSAFPHAQSATRAGPSRPAQTAKALSVSTSIGSTQGSGRLGSRDTKLDEEVKPRTAAELRRMFESWEKLPRMEHRRVRRESAMQVKMEVDATAMSDVMME